MNAERFRTALELIGLTQNGFARFVQVDPRTVRRWALDELPVPISVVLTVELMVKFKVTPDKARAIAKLEPAE